MTKQDTEKLINKIKRSGAADLLRLRPTILEALEEKAQKKKKGGD